MKKFLNYLGQLRLYSLADLILLLVALDANWQEITGAVILHIAFLAYLESRHRHTYRVTAPLWLAPTLAVIGLVLFGKVEGILFLIFSYLYTLKNKKFGYISPIFRGLQIYFIIAGIIGYASPVTFLVFLVMTVRNLLGDLRDVEKDRKEGVKTLPVILGFKKSIPHIHLFAMLASSCIWWILLPLSFWWLVAVILVEVTTYNMTPR